MFGQQESPLDLPESTRGHIPRTSQRCCRCEDAAQHVQRRWPVSSEQTTRDGSLWTPTTIQRGRTCAREQTQDTTTSMGSRAMVAEHAPHHTLVFHGVGACSRARWTARPLRRHRQALQSFLDDLTPWTSLGDLPLLVSIEGYCTGCLARGNDPQPTGTRP